jgi:hypothetical protein
MQSVIIHSANGGKGEGCLVEEYSVVVQLSTSSTKYNKELLDRKVAAPV